jgi:hypothetical protein
MSSKNYPMRSMSVKGLHSDSSHGKKDGFDSESRYQDSSKCNIIFNVLETSFNFQIPNSKAQDRRLFNS